MIEVDITSIEGHRLHLEGGQRSTGTGEPWSLLAVLENSHGRASSPVWDVGNELIGLFNGIARDWRGWDGTRSYSSLEGELDIAARHDGIGQIRLVVSLGSLSPPSWRLETEMTLGAGAHAETVAASVAGLIAALEPGAPRN